MRGLCRITYLVQILGCGLHKVESVGTDMRAILQSGEAGVMGVFAQLGTVDQEALSRVLAANYRSMLVVLIVEDAGCRNRLEQLMSKSRQA